ncbi:MAG: ssDNA-binding domain-containing protein [Phycisphaerae bacterium]|nr:ssDNA-binding domain-containing protein [Phycisphaerae bacterium]
MKAEQAKKVADQALEQLSQALAAGKSEELTRYLSMLAKFHKYSFGNVMVILSQKPDATHVAGFNTWKQMGRYVRQGEKGIVIIAPMVFRKSENRSGGRDADLARTRARALASRRGPPGRQDRPRDGGRGRGVCRRPGRGPGCRAAADHAPRIGRLRAARTVLNASFAGDGFQTGRGGTSSFP